MKRLLGVRVFSATRGSDRQQLGAVITQWLRAHPEVEIEDKHVVQSSDASFHCLTVVVFYRYTSS